MSVAGEFGAHCAVREDRCLLRPTLFQKQQATAPEPSRTGSAQDEQPDCVTAATVVDAWLFTHVSPTRQARDRDWANSRFLRHVLALSLESHKRLFNSEMPQR
jgi:hypothetical protein